MKNLLPPNHYYRNWSDYRWRRIATALFLLTALILVATVLVALQIIRLKIEDRAINHLAQSLEQRDEHQAFLSARQEINQVNRRLKILAGLPPAGQTADLLEAVVGLKPPAVRLTGFNYSTSTNQAGNLTVVGQALTRADLLLLIDRLKQSPAFSKVESPVGNLVKERDAEFIITLTVN